jgi:hypothetical protein
MAFKSINKPSSSSVYAKSLDPRGRGFERSVADLLTLAFLRHLIGGGPSAHNRRVETLRKQSSDRMTRRLRVFESVFVLLLFLCFGSVRSTPQPSSVDYGRESRSRQPAAAAAISSSSFSFQRDSSSTTSIVMVDTDDDDAEAMTEPHHHSQSDTVDGTALSSSSSSVSFLQQAGLYGEWLREVLSLRVGHYLAAVSSSWASLLSWLFEKQQQQQQQKQHPAVPSLNVTATAAMESHHQHPGTAFINAAEHPAVPSLNTTTTTAMESHHQHPSTAFINAAAEFVNNLWHHLVDYIVYIPGTVGGTTLSYLASMASSLPRFEEVGSGVSAFFSSSLAWLSSWFGTVGTIRSFFSVLASMSASSLPRFEQVAIYVVAIFVYIFAFAQAIVTFDYGLGKYLLVSIIESVLFHVTAIIESISTKDAIIGVIIVVYVSILRFLLFRPSFRGRADGHNGTTTITSFSLVSAPVFGVAIVVYRIIGFVLFHGTATIEHFCTILGQPTIDIVRNDIINDCLSSSNFDVPPILRLPSDRGLNRQTAAQILLNNRTCVSFAFDVEFNGGKPSSQGTVEFKDAAIFWWSAEEEHGFMAGADPEYLTGNKLRCYNDETGQLEIYDNDDDDGFDFGGSDDEPELVADANAAGDFDLVQNFEMNDDADVDDTGLNNRAGPFGIDDDDHDDDHDDDLDVVAPASSDDDGDEDDAAVETMAHNQTRQQQNRSGRRTRLSAPEQGRHTRGIVDDDIVLGSAYVDGRRRSRRCLGLKQLGTIMMEHGLRRSARIRALV